MKKYIMALDQGTTGSRCILFTKDGNIAAMSKKEFTQIYPRPSWVEHDPMEIWSSQMSVIKETMDKISASAKDIDSIGITNQRETTIIWTKGLVSLFTMLLYGSAEEVLIGWKRLREME